MELAKKVKELRKLEAEAAELMEQAETLRDEIKAEMRERGVESRGFQRPVCKDRFQSL